MGSERSADATKAVVRRNTEEKIHFETVDVMRVHNGKITEHWGVANLSP